MPQQKYNKLAGKHVLVIGGSSGIGFGVAEAAIESGAKVTISSSNLVRIEAALKSLTSSYPDAIVAGYVCDLSTPTLEQNIEQLFVQTGNVNHIVFTAGDKLAQKSIHDITLEDIKAAGQVRFFAPLLVAKVGSKYLSAGPESSITLTTGSSGERPKPDWPIVASYCAGLHGMARNLALDLKPIRVNAVSPGSIETPLWERLSSDARDKAFDAIREKVPTGRVGQPDDVAEAYLWLMKDKNVTGIVVSSDSGASIV